MNPTRIFLSGVLAMSFVALCGCSKELATPTAPHSLAAVSSGTAPEPINISREEFMQWIALHNARHQQSSSLKFPMLGAQGSLEPTPIPGGFGPGFHVWVPGPAELGAQGLNVEPGTVTDFNGFSAVGYFAGTCLGSDGVTYEMFNDMRLQKGTYVAVDGSIRRGTFAFTWIDLFEPGSGLTVQLHDYNGGIAPSGLFWTTLVPDNAVSISADAATIKVNDLPVVDSFVIFGPNEVPATASYALSFAASGPVRHLTPGSNDPTDPTNLSGIFRDATATGTFSASSITMPGGGPFSFHGAVGTAVWAEVGNNRNGKFLH